MGRIYVATSDDISVLEAVFRNKENSSGHRASAWYRYETIKWYTAFKEGRLILSHLDIKQARAVREYIMERNMRTNK